MQSPSSAKPPALSPSESACLLGLAIFGFLVPNGCFVYFALTRPDLVEAAIRNPVAMVFMGEALLLMFLFAWLLKRAGTTSPGPWVFIALSLIGSLAFSVPLTLRKLLSRGLPSK